MKPFVTATVVGIPETVAGVADLAVKLSATTPVRALTVAAA